MPLSKPLLTRKHREQHYQWAVSMKDQDWNKVNAADETIIRLNSTKRLSWQKLGQPVFRRV
ncbi:unnamed protein product, partial [Rotaria sp. Silwood2]